MVDLIAALQTDSSLYFVMSFYAGAHARRTPRQPTPRHTAARGTREGGTQGAGAE